MNEIKLKKPNIWEDEEWAPIFLLRRGAERRNRQRELIVEALKNVHPQKPTARNLQKLARIRRKGFLPLLKRLVEKGDIARYGSGTRGDPFVYGIAP